MHDISGLAVSLPIELWVIIFEMACLYASDDNVTLLEVYGCDLRYTRSSISLTCRRWRSVVLTTASLWSTITCQDDHEIHSRRQSDRSSIHRDSYHLLNEELARSGRHPLSLHLMRCRPAGGIPLEDVIHSNIGRCRKLHVNFSRPEDITNLRDIISSSASNISLLRHLLIHYSGSSTHGPVQGMLDLTDAVELRELSLMHCWGGNSIASVIFPPNICNIRRLKLRGYLPGDRLAHICLALQSLKRMETFEWDIPHTNSLPVPNFEEVYLPNLLHLSVAGLIAVAWLSSLNAPRLERLNVVGFEYGRQSWGDGLKLSPTLRHVDFYTHTSSPSTESQIKFLQSHPNLEMYRTNATLDSPLAEYLGNVYSPHFCSAKLRHVTMEGISPLDPDTADHLLSRLLALRAASIVEYPFTLHPYHTSRWKYTTWRLEHDCLTEKYPGIYNYAQDPAFHTSPWDWIIPFYDSPFRVSRLPGFHPS